MHFGNNSAGSGLWRWLSYAETIYSENIWERSDCLSYAGGALIQVADSAGSTVCLLNRAIKGYKIAAVACIAEPIILNHAWVQIPKHML